MPVFATLILRCVAPALLAGALGGACLAQTLPSDTPSASEAEAVVAQCARLSTDIGMLKEGLDQVPGLTPLPLDDFEPDGPQGQPLRMALAYNAALEGIVATDLIAPEDQLQRAFEAVSADTPWLPSGEGGGAVAYADAAGRLYIVERSITTGRQGRRVTRCLLIAPMGAVPPTPALPEGLQITNTPSLSVRGFSVSAFQGQIPYTDASASPDASAGFSMVTMPVPPETAIASLAGIGGVTIFRHSVSNRTPE